MTRRRLPYDPASPLWWGINEDGTPNEQKLREIVAAIVRTANPARIVLFGSAAAGTMDQDSDVDLLVVMETTTPRRTAQRLRSSAPPESPPLDIVVATAADVERTQHDPLFVTHDALTHGRVLYHVPGYRLHPLSGDRRGQWSVRVSGNWRIVFRFEDGVAVDVTLVDYH